MPAPALLSAAAGAGAGGGGAVYATTTAGVVRGFVANATRVFRGVPYAAPPVGPLRLRPPQPPRRWGAARDATRFGPTCLASSGWASERGVSNSSEDCLYANVYAPSGGGGAWPVMVYIPAGEFLVGSSNDAENNFPYNPALAAGVVLVTLNFRLGWLGFAALDALRALSPTGATGNLGMEDQREALRWVRGNARAFGGDPGRVTIFGESSGGTSVGYHLANSRSWGLFSGAVLESPGLTQVRSLADATDSTEWALSLLAHNGSAGCARAEGRWRRYAGALLLGHPSRSLANATAAAACAACDGDPECFGFSLSANGTASLHASGASARDNVQYAGWDTWAKAVDPGAAVGCLLAADARAMSRAKWGRAGPHTSTLRTDWWAPAVDGAELAAPVMDLLANGTIAPGVAVLMGGNKDEATTFAINIRAPRAAMKCGDASAGDFSAWADATYGGGMGERLAPLYEPARLDTPVPPCPHGAAGGWYAAAQRVVTDDTVLCLVRTALRASAAGARRAWSYYFAYTPAFSVNFKGNLSHYGAFHGAEVPFVFGDTFELTTPFELLLSRRMGCYWANFATSGDPNDGPHCAGDLPQWPAYRSSAAGATVEFSAAGGVSPRDGLHDARCTALATSNALKRTWR